MLVTGLSEAHASTALAHGRHAVLWRLGRAGLPSGGFVIFHISAGAIARLHAVGI
jgi:hypothetical protein